MVAASALLWVDPGAAANRLRFAIEELLTAEGMRRFVNRDHKRVRLSTHMRIQEFKKYAGSAGDALEAVKWIGNSGSHDDELTATDVLDGVDLLRHALRSLYDKEDERVETSKGASKRSTRPAGYRSPPRRAGRSRSNPHPRGLVSPA